MDALRPICFIFGSVAVIIGLRIIKMKHWVDISKYSFESIDIEGNSAIFIGAIFLFIGIVLIALGGISLFLM